MSLNLSIGEARRVHLTPEQQTQLAKADSIFIKVLALTEKGPADHRPFLKTITTRLQELNYTVILELVGGWLFHDPCCEHRVV